MMPRFHGSSAMIMLLSVLWVALFVYNKHIVPARVASRCKWGTIKGQKNVMFVADPQLIDSHTYPGRNSLLKWLSQHTVDVNLKQNYKALIRHLQPDYVMFLGDYLENGRLSSEQYYEDQFSRFERIFNRFPKYTRGKNLFTSVPGKHDVGFGNGVNASLQAQFSKHFGAPNTVQLIDGVDFVMLDSPSFSSEDPEIRKEAAKFLDLLPPPTNPRILLSHIPLFRGTALHPCEPLRERNPFLQVAGYQYQLTINPDLLHEILSKVQPKLLFASDDHLNCDITHTNGTKEIAVKSINMPIGIKYPAVLLLSYAVDLKQLDYDTYICYLPQPYVDVFFYVVMAVTSAAIIIVCNIKRRPWRYNYSMLPKWNPERTSSDLSEEHEVISRKVYEFVINLDKSWEFISLPNYTFTPRTWEKRYERALLNKKQSLFRIMKKWNVWLCLKHLFILGVLALVLYILVVAFI